MYWSKGVVKVGEVLRYVVNLDLRSVKNDEECDVLFLRVRNLERMPLRAAYLNGPFSLYVDVTRADYDPNKRAGTPNDEPQFEPDLKAGQAFVVQLHLDKVATHSAVNSWVVNVSSQIIFSRTASIAFEIAVARSKKDLDMPKSARSEVQSGACLNVQVLDTNTLWNSPSPRLDTPVHLVILSHGLHSNTGADLLFLKEKIDDKVKSTGENVIVRGFFENVCKTEKGVKYLGRRLADFIVEDLVPGLVSSGARVHRISFIGHSLGGLVQFFAIAHIRSLHPHFFVVHRPTIVICLATPFLGISQENPVYVRLALEMGFVGKTGQDLGLSSYSGQSVKYSKPLLEILPTGPTHQALKQFSHRTLYANAINDGIVPLRTAAIMYLDWEGLERAHNLNSTQEEQKAQTATLEAQDLTGEQESTLTSQLSANSLSTVSVQQAHPVSGKIETKSPTQTEEVKLNHGSFFQPADFFDKFVTKPASALATMWAPQSSTKRLSKSSREDQVPDSATDALLKPASAFESGVSVLCMPLPSREFIINPEIRTNAIFHDKVYNSSNLPRPRLRHRKSTFTVRNRSESEHLELDEKIAREWHRHLDWRKVLVKLEPDAHNNIVVRRRFVNAYGWSVIEHLVEQHFGIEPRTARQQEDQREFSKKLPVKAEKSTSLEPENLESSHPAKVSGRTTRSRTWPCTKVALDAKKFENKLGEPLEFAIYAEPRPPSSSPEIPSPDESNASANDNISQAQKIAWERHLSANSQDSEDEGWLSNVNTFLGKLTVQKPELTNFTDTEVPKSPELSSENENVIRAFLP